MCIADDQWPSFIHHPVTTGAGHGTIHQPVIGAYTTSMLYILVQTMQPCLSTTFLFSDMGLPVTFGIQCCLAQFTDLIEKLCALLRSCHDRSSSLLSHPFSCQESKYLGSGQISPGTKSEHSAGKYAPTPVGF